jgi:lipoyl(octanoyl) transferase
MNRNTIIFRDLGEMSYKEAWDYQESLLQENIQAKANARIDNSDAKTNN